MVSIFSCVFRLFGFLPLKNFCLVQLPTSLLIQETEMQNTVEGHSSSLEQEKDRISELKNKTETKGKTEEMLVKQLKTCKWKVQELTDCIKRPNLKILGIGEGEEIQAKEIHNISNKTKTENFQNFKKFMPIQIQEPSRIPNRLDQNRTSP
jgi:hypothetical protein